MNNARPAITSGLVWDTGEIGAGMQRSPPQPAPCESHGAIESSRSSRLGNSGKLTEATVLRAYAEERNRIFKFNPIQQKSTLLLESVREFYDPLEFTSQLQ